MKWFFNLNSKVVNFLLFKLSGYLKCKIINNDNGEPYLEKYFIFRWGKKRRAIFLHRFLNSAPENCIHNHPWDGKSLILTGGYSERKLIEYEGKEKIIWKTIKPFSINSIKSNDFHQIILKNKKPVWTLFYHGERKKDWGFHYYNFQEDASIKKGEFIPYKNKQKEGWELKALKGKDLKRAPLKYIEKKK